MLRAYSRIFVYYQTGVNVEKRSTTKVQELVDQRTVHTTTNAPVASENFELPLTKPVLFGNRLIYMEYHTSQTVILK
jgi:hypothetical protein